MFKHQVKDPGAALAYITDCTLATVSGMAMRKSRSQREYERQKAIAQQAVEWMLQMGVDLAATRAVEVVEFGSVEKWAAQYELRK